LHLSSDVLMIWHVHIHSTAEASSLDSTPTFQNANNRIHFPSHGATGPTEPEAPLRVSSVTLRHTTRSRTRLGEWSARQTHNTQHSRQTSIRTRNPSKRSRPRQSALKHKFHFSNKGVWATEGASPLVSKLDTRWEISGQLHASADLAVQDRLRMTATRRLAELQGRAGRRTDETISRSSQELRDHNLVTTPTELVSWCSEVFPLTDALQIQIWIPVSISLVSRLLF